MRAWGATLVALFAGITMTSGLFAEDPKVGFLTEPSAVPDSLPNSLAAPVERCIRDNASKAEAAIPDLNEAVDFLVLKICAEPIADEQARRNRVAQQKMLEDMQRQCEDAKAKGDKDMVQADCMNGRIGFTGLEQYMEDSAITINEPRATTLAARLLLDLRLSHKHAEH
jgi:hypothetical protein